MTAREALERARDAITALTPETDGLKIDGKPMFRNGHASCRYRARDLINEMLAALPSETVPLEASDHLLATVKPRPLEHPLDAYWTAPGGTGPLTAEWADKPHRLIFDLIAALLHADQSRT